MSDLITSYIRTGVPIVIGSFVAWLAVHGLQVPADSVTGFTAFLTGLFTALYYAVVRYLETKYPQMGWLLGSAKKVVYKDSVLK